MRTHTTTTLHTLVVKELDPTLGTMDKTTADNWIQQLPDIRFDINLQIRLMAFGRVRNKLLVRHIRQLQCETVRLINVLERYEDISPKLDMLYQMVLSMLKEVIEHLSSYYPKYFSLDLPVPDTQFKDVLVTVSEKMKPLVSRLRNKNADKALLKMIEDSVADFMKADNCSYYRLLYMEGLLDSLINLCSEVEREEVDEQLKEHLIYYNLNTAAHVKYYKKTIPKEAAELFDEQEKFELFCEYQRHFRSYTQRKGSAFSSKNESIKTMLLNYIGAEISCYKKKHALGNTKKSILHNESNAENKYRLPVSISVDALTYFFKLLTESGIIAGIGPRTKLLSFIAMNFQTPGTGLKAISPKSMENKYKQVVQSTAKTVQTVLLRMLKIIDDEFMLPSRKI